MRFDRFPLIVTALKLAEFDQAKTVRLSRGESAAAVACAMLA
jgi:hypothetical protein